MAGWHPSVLRRANSIEVFHAIRLNAGLSQRDIGERTGIDKSTISTIINQFDALGLLHRVVDEGRRGRGRPSEGFALNIEAGILVGIDIVPEHLVITSSGLDGVPRQATEHPPIAGESAVGPAVGAALRAHLAELGLELKNVRSVGACIPGLVDRAGKLISSTNLKWGTVDLPAVLAAEIGQPVWIDNDARAAGLAEKLFGCCIDVDDFVFINSHSGVGGALYLEGAIYAGSGGIGGEIGHTKIVPHGRICQCGKSGCLSAYISGPALRDAFAGAGMRVRTFKEMKLLADDGVPAALDVLDEAGEIFGLALANFVDLLNPPNIVIGGGLAVLAPHLMKPLLGALDRQAMPEPRAMCSILVSELSLHPHSFGPLAVALQGLSQLNADGAFPW